MKKLLLISIVACLLCLAGARAQERAAERAGFAFFESKIRPALVVHCYKCHSIDSGKTRGGLLLDSRERILSGGETGPAVVALSPEKSLLYQAIQYDGDIRMPPQGKLPDTVIADFRKWIEMGAPFPADSTSHRPHLGVVKSEIDLERGRQYWAYRKSAKPEPPVVGNALWPRSDIDRFVMAGLEENKLTPVSDGDARVLVRRLFFVLTGLPPTTDDAEDWTTTIESAPNNDTRQQRIASLVDKLLDSPQFGERWGRHWMDVSRFAESTGGDKNNVFQHAWRYRDYVIDSFNDDKPFDRFVMEQIAGDLLPIGSDEEWAYNIIATGFLAVGQKLVGEEDQQKFFADLVDEQIDTTTRAFLASTVACTRCHDHKFDPIPQTDYYALAGIFRSTETHYGLLPAQARQSTTLIDLTGMGPPAGAPTLSPDQYAELVAARDRARQIVDDAMRKIRAGENVFRGTLRRIRSDRDETETALQSYDSGGNPRVFAMGAQDREFPLDTHLLVRGEIDKPAQRVPRGVLQALSPPGRHEISDRAATIVADGKPYRSVSGRLEFAAWIASAENPLTARVVANRIWHWMFGNGLVRTVDDFGRSGEVPSHPELLDYLAVRLVENGWSVKSLIREIALSRTWQLSSDFHERNFAVDPESRFLWRMNKRRLEAEAVRDAMLAVSGNLKAERPLGTLLRDVGEGVVGQNVFEPVIRAIESNHRSVYLPRVRSALSEPLELFDAPDASLVTGARETTQSPLQALYMLNNSFIQQQAEGVALRAAERPESERIEFAYLLCLGRPPSESERRHAASFIDRIGESTGLSKHEKLVAYCQALLCTAEFCSID